MTDQEKTAVLVGRLFGGKWPTCHVVLCRRCGAINNENDRCLDFRPFESIEDAFAVADRLNLEFRVVRNGDGDFAPWYAAFDAGTSRPSHDASADTPARAIAEAAYLAVVTMTPCATRPGLGRRRAGR